MAVSYTHLDVYKRQVCGIVLYNTKPGRYILCLGSNSEAVRLSGVNTRKWRMLAYVICGFLVGIGALFFVATYTTVQPGYGDQYNNEAIAGLSLIHIS